MAVSVVFPVVQFTDLRGRPLSGGRIHTYVHGTNIRAMTYQDAKRTARNTNPIILNARGEAAIYLDEGVAYKFVVQDADGATIMTQEPVYGAVWPNPDEWPDNATLAYRYMTEAKGAADAIGPVAFFDTHSQAMAEIGDLNDGDIIEVFHDENRDGARTRYRVEKPNLVFLVNLDQLRIDLADTDNPKFGAGLLADVRTWPGAVSQTQREINRDYVSLTNALNFPVTAASVDAALASATAVSALIWIPEGVWPITQASVPLLDRVFGPGVLEVGGSLLPAGDIRENLTLPVPSVFSDIYEAWDYLATRKFSRDVMATISIAAGTYDVDRSLSKIPFGNQVQIVGAGKDSTILRWMGPEWVGGSTANRRSFVDLEKGGHINFIDGLTLDGNSRRGQSNPPNSSDPHGIILRRDSHITVGRDMRIKDWARVGLLCNQGSTALILGDAVENVEFSGCYTEGVVASAGCTIISQYTRSNNNSGYGFWADAGGIILGTQLTANGNSGAGIFAFQGGQIICGRGTSFSSQTNNNGNGGIYANGNGYIQSPQALLSGNAPHNVRAIYGSGINLRGTAAARSIIDGGADHSVVAMQGSFIDLFRAQVSGAGADGVHVDNSRVEMGLANITNCAGSEINLIHGATASGDLVEASGSGGNHRTLVVGTGCVGDFPRGSFTASGANAQAVSIAGGRGHITSGLISGPSEPNGYAYFLAYSGVLNITGSSVSGWQSPPPNTEGIRNSYAHA